MQQEEILAAACNAVIQMQGGMAVVIDGVVIATLPLPLSGLTLEAPLSEIAEQFVPCVVPWIEWCSGNRPIVFSRPVLVPVWRVTPDLIRLTGAWRTGVSVQRRCHH